MQVAGFLHAPENDTRSLQEPVEPSFPRSLLPKLVWGLVGLASGRVWHSLGRLLGATWSAALEASSFKPRNSGSPVFWLHFGSSGKSVSFWRSWALLGRLFDSLGASWDAFLAQVGPSWPNRMKKVDFLNLPSAYDQDLGPKLGPQIEKNRCQKPCFFRTWC